MPEYTVLYGLANMAGDTMKLFATRSAYFLWLFLASTMLPRGVASAQAPAETTQAVLPNERLSDWLLRRPLPADA